MLKHVTVVKSSFFSHDKCHCPSLFSTIRVGERKYRAKKGVEKRLNIYILVDSMSEKNCRCLLTLKLRTSRSLEEEYMQRSN